MFSARILRGFTLVEIAAVLVVVSLLALAASLTMRSTEKTGLDTQARNTLVAFTAAQALRHDTLGSFVSSPSDAPTILSNYTYASASTPSSKDTEVSFKVGSVGGFDFLSAAVLSPSGRCFIVKAFESSSPTEDMRRFFEPGVITCNANAVESISGGESW